MTSIQELFHANLFSDYLEMASFLLQEGYKDPSAVIAGTTLETHLKQLCIKNKIDIENIDNKGKNRHRKADLLNSDLAKNKIYNKNVQKQNTAWLGIRNSSAHGKYGDYDASTVKFMISGIRNFIMNYPA